MSTTSESVRSANFTSWLDELLAVLAISYWVGSIVGQTLGTVIALCCLPNKYAVLFLAWQVRWLIVGQGGPLWLFHLRRVFTGV